MDNTWWTSTEGSPPPSSLLWVQIPSPALKLIPYTEKGKDDTDN